MCRQYPSRAGLIVAFILMFSIWSVAPGFAQNVSVRGFVTDASNGEALAGVNVVVEGADGAQRGTATDGDGFYTIPRLEAGRYALRASFVGFQTAVDTLELAAGEGRVHNVTLVPTTEELGELVVDAARGAGAAALTAGLQTVQPADVERVPGPGPSSDLAMYLATVPGVVTTGDQGGQFFIRGGEPSQNLVVLDGMLVYQPFHILGFYSAFPAAILNSVDVYAGGYGARYGGRISSVIDVTTRGGNNRRTAGAVTLSPFLVGARAEGPLLPSGRLTFLTSFRHSVVEQGAARLINHPVPFLFNDAFAKIQGPAFNRNGRLSITALRTYDRGTAGEATGGQPRQAVRWRNDAYGARYLFLPGTLPMLAEFLVSLSRLKSELGPGERTTRSSSTARLNLAGNVTYYSRLADVQWGLFARTLRLDSELGGLYQNVALEREFLTEAGAYLAPAFKPHPGVRVTPSLRVHAFPSKGRTYLEPRVRAVWQRGDHQVSGAAGLYHQEVVGITDRRDAASVFTAWTAVPFGQVPRAFHAILGYTARPTPGLTFTVEGYAKWLAHLYVAEWTAFPRFTTRLQQADGRVRGLDLRLEWRQPAVYGYVNYGLSSVEYEAMQRSIPLWFGSETLRFRPAHDRRHQLNVLVNTHVRGFDVSARWQFGSGLPFNRALGFDGFILMNGFVDVFEETGSRRVIYERPFNGVLPAYHRLDVSVKRTFSWRQARVTAEVDMINVYDRPNIFYLDVFTLQRADQLPFVPSFGLTVATD